MKQIIITKNNIDNYIRCLSLPNTLLVYSGKCSLASDYIKSIGVEIDDFRRPDVLTSIRQDTSLIVVGISDIIKPSNRCDEVFENIFNSHLYSNKIVIDDKPFFGELWRCWFLFATVKQDALRYPHSYALESAYNNYLEGRGDNPLDLGIIRNEFKDIVKVEYDRYFDFNIQFKVHETSSYQKEEYQRIKREVFDNWKSISSSIKTLHTYTTSILQEHNLPRNRNKLYNIDRDYVFHLTDLNVDIYLMNEIKKLYNDTNNLIKALR